MNITIVGLGYVGLSLSTLLSTKHNVTCIDINKERVDSINNGISPIKDNEIEKYLSNKKLTLTATTSTNRVYENSDIVFISVPTNYDEKLNFFNTSIVESVIEEILQKNNEVLIVIKSTIPIGFTKRMREKFNTNKIFFSPEFLREGRALYDNLYPSRIIVGHENEEDNAKLIIKTLSECSLKKNIKTFIVGLNESECVKLFSNTYLALRVAYFNELDSFCLNNGYNTEEIINGVCADERIGNNYANPSFGYGGYCLPKDTKQLLANFKDSKHPKCPTDLISAIVDSNWSRKMHILSHIIFNYDVKTIGIYRLTMKNGSDNMRESSIIPIVKGLNSAGYNIIVYEPMLNKSESFFTLENDLQTFKNKSELILTNRVSDEIIDVSDKIFTRDIYNCN